jgi:radical SAM superfamily enzyme YgiQ (UPF0313 family)
MELTCRQAGDILLPPGAQRDLRGRLARLGGSQPIPTIAACAFDHRTRMLPFIYADTHMVPAGVRTIAAELIEAGIGPMRIVLQQWNKHFRPSQARLDGEMPQLILLSSMSLHTEPFRAMLRDIATIPQAQRPLVIAGGSICIYEPWDAFAEGASADLAVTGESYVLLNLLEVLLTERSEGETLREAFLRVRDQGALDDVPGLVYAKGNDGRVEQLIDTGLQQLLGDFDELAGMAEPFGILDPPGRHVGLADAPMTPRQVQKRCTLTSLILTQGCKFKCPYCPIPAYNQRQYRTKSGQRIAEDLRAMHEGYGLRTFFGSDDNFFNDEARTVDICEALARAEVAGKPLRKSCRISTEVTVHDTLRLRDHLDLVRKAGLRALWLGVEDLSGTLVSKGQTADKTAEAFALMRQRGIVPMPMMMHHDGQPLWTRGSHYGLLNQVALLARAGASGLQVLMVTPSAGSKLYEETFTSGMVFEAVAGRKVLPHMLDGNYVIASNDDGPWRKQLNILAAYLYFYNPLRLLGKLLHPRNRQLALDVGMQLWGMWGLAYTIRRTLGWAVRLAIGPIRRRSRPPAPPVPITAPDGSEACHFTASQQVAGQARAVTNSQDQS